MAVSRAPSLDDTAIVAFVIIIMLTVGRINLVHINLVHT